MHNICCDNCHSHVVTLSLHSSPSPFNIHYIYNPPTHPLSPLNILLFITPSPFSLSSSFPFPPTFPPLSVPILFITLPPPSNSLPFPFPGTMSESDGLQRQEILQHDQPRHVVFLHRILRLSVVVVGHFCAVSAIGGGDCASYDTHGCVVYVCPCECK